MAKTALSDKMLDLIAQRFRTLGEPCRLRLLQTLETGEKTVGDLVQALDGNQPNISKHLQILHEAGLVSRRREATSIIYSISDPMVFRICDLACRSATEKSRKQFEDLQPAAIPARRRKK
jgi:DNA-binding transcriptional ArsR family regulator